MFDYFYLDKIDRLQNKDADQLSRIASGDIPNQLLVEVEVSTSSPIDPQNHIMAVTPGEVSWIDEIKNYIEKDLLPENCQEAQKIRRHSARYVVHEGILYRRSFTKPLLRCIPPDMVQSVLEEIHEGVCGGHPGARALATRVLHQGYYWPTLRQDALDFVKKCHACQIFGDVPRLPSVQQTPVLATWPFDIWGMDLMGRFPKSRSGCEYLVVAVDYFSKWIEAQPLASPSEENVIKFFRNSVLCRFGVPRAVVTDHGTQFSSKFTAECERFHVRHWRSSVAHPQGNGQAEAANKLVLRSLKKTLEGTSKKWIDELHTVLWSVRTSARGPTGETPFALVYGSEAVAPAELALPTHRVMTYSSIDNDQNRRNDLDLLDEKRKTARLRMEAYKGKTKMFHDKKVVYRPLHVGDWVLRKIEGTARALEADKLTPNWEGPYRIHSEIRKGTFRLIDKEGILLRNPWHANHLKKYYV